MWILKIRIGKEYFSVNWDKGSVNIHRPTIFNKPSRIEAEVELVRAGHKPNDYYFEKVSSDQVLSPSGLETDEHNVVDLSTYWD